MRLTLILVSIFTLACGWPPVAGAQDKPHEWKKGDFARPANRAGQCLHVAAVDDKKPVALALEGQCGSAGSALANEWVPCSLDFMRAFYPDGWQKLTEEECAALRDDKGTSP